MTRELNHLRTVAAGLLCVAVVTSAGCSKVSETLGLSSKPSNTVPVERSNDPAASDAAATATPAPPVQAPAASAVASRSRPPRQTTTAASPRNIAGASRGAPSSHEQPGIDRRPAEVIDLTAPALDSKSAVATAPTKAPVIVNGGGDGSRIYSKDDADVIPARLLTVQKGAPTFRNVTPDINTMELVVSKQGRVEQVKLLSPTKRMTDMLLLSGAKTWKFAPALKNGQPVRYRTLFSWEMTP